MAANQENNVRVTRAARKRAAAALQPCSPPPARKKRVALGELQNFSNVLPDINTGNGGDPKASLKPLKLRTEEREEPVDVDLVSEDPILGSAYASDIYQYLRSAEVKRRPRVNFIDSIQNDITANMRGILVDWLVEVAEEYKLISDTLYLTISYIDRFLSSNAIKRQRLQLLGVSCMLIASKYEEISPPHVEDFCYITDNSYTKEEVVQMEREILKFLNFEMSSPTIKTFLRRFNRASQEGNKTSELVLEFLGNYLAELSLLDYGCVRFFPSIIAASVIFLARFTLRPQTHPWTSTLQHYTGYKSSDLKDCVIAIHSLQLNTKGCSLAAIRDKYKSHKFKCVSSLSPPTEIPSQFFEDING
ncbi:cyclin-A3-1 isoform X2 [Amborella trichopoda]|uniref:cyclin-A3-1 isoform X2 n=1 Tax=Amborella trichopoda TaxID=13333 RepID=UPI0005D38CD3|nr:cyclin-A3-1 isoform X2 [Amborella trichopoda]|eukprot:XP_011629119.1 cyclin-A3-1 isoform X2 [Amborella trichopoda]